MKKEYVSPTIDVVALCPVDIITVSDDNYIDGDWDNWE